MRRVTEKSVDAIARRLELTREALGLRPAQFADGAGVGRNTYSQWAKGRGRPQIDEAIKLCETYGITLDWIYLGDPTGLPFRIARALPAPSS